MDENEKAVLRRRRNDIADRLADVTTELINDANSIGLLGRDGLRAIQREKTGADKAGRIIDTIISINHQSALSGLCAILRRSSAQHLAQLADDLEGDLRLERGEVRPRQEMVDEASSIVHRLDDVQYEFVIECMTGILLEGHGNTKSCCRA